jgi:hypothetical protein
MALGLCTAGSSSRQRFPSGREAQSCSLRRVQAVDEAAGFGVERPHRDEPTLGVVSQPSRRRLGGGEERLLGADLGIGLVGSEGEVGVEVHHGDHCGGRVDAPDSVGGDVHRDRGAGGRQVASAWTGRPSARASRYMSTLQPLRVWCSGAP